MELVVAAETETGQLASDGPGPPTETPTTEGMAKTGLREPQAVFPTVTSLRVSVERLLAQCAHVIPLSPQIAETVAFRHTKDRS